MRLLDDLRRDLLAFLKGHDVGVLRLQIAQDHLAYVYQLLAEQENTSSDVFLLFPHAFHSPDELAGLVAERVDASARAAGARPYVSPVSVSAATQLRAALVHARALLPTGAAPRLIVALCPLSGADSPAYHDLVEQLLAPATPVPWFHRMRLLVLDDPAHPVKPHPLVRTRPVDLSPDAMARSLRAEADDPTTLPDRRAHAILELAGLDHAHRRFSAALARYHELLALAQAAAHPLFTALALLGLGDVERAENHLPAAQVWYERALAPAGEAAAPIVLLLVARNLGHLYFDQGRHADAEICFDSVQSLAVHTADPETRTDALEWRGRCQQRRGETQPGLVSLASAALLAHEHKLAAVCQRLTAQLRRAPLELLPPDLRTRVHHDLLSI